MDDSLSKFNKDYKKQMELGSISKAYKGLMKYLMNLRTHFLKKYPGEFSVGSFYQGYMDISYFPLSPASLKNQKLKIGLVFNHEKFQFEIWLVGQNKKIQKDFWDWLNEIAWDKYQLSPSPQNSIIKKAIVTDPNFSDLDSLTDKIEKETLSFIKTILEIQDVGS